MGQSCCHCHESKKENVFQYLLPAFSFIMLVGGLVINEAEIEFFFSPRLNFIWYGAAYLLVGLPVLKEAWECICRGSLFNEFTLMTIATFGAFYIGEYPEGVAVMLFYTIGEIFQQKAVCKSRRNIKSLLDVRPEEARVSGETGVRMVSPAHVNPGEIIEVRAGERLPLDGKLLTDMAVFDTAALTGESMPRNMYNGEEVLAGMIVTDRVVHIEVTRPYGQSALARILTLVEEAAERKAPAELFIRKIARIYTPVVTGLALCVILFPWVYSFYHPAFEFVFQDWLYRALVFLVLSCPCALVVSIPLGYFGGIGAASRQGILFKGGNYLDAITKVNTIVFDKTGTLTKGVFEVREVSAEGKEDTSQLVSYIASIEQHSNHPVARAVIKYASHREIGLSEISGVKEWAGYGLTGQYEGQDLQVGNTGLLEKYGIAYPPELKSIPETIVCCALNGQYIGYILLADTLRADSRKAIRDLRREGIRHICILSGDKQALVTKLGTELGDVEATGGLLPEDKARRLERLKADQDNNIAFVGDGINDAPALAMSHVGIAMGGLGSDAAIESADIVIQDDQPSKVAVAIRIGRQTRKIIWQNIFLTMAIKVVILALGAAGIATLWEAVFADVGVALLAIGNAVRILRKKAMTVSPSEFLSGQKN